MGKLSLKRDTLDAFDKKILKALTENGYLRNTELAEKVNLSKSACYQRVARLKKMGVFKGFVPVIHIPGETPYIQFFTLIMLEKQDRREFDMFNRRLKVAPGIIQAHRVTGDFDYSIQSRFATVEAYEEMIENLFQDINIKQYQTRIVKSEIVHQKNVYV